VHLLWVELRDFRNHAETALEVPDGLVGVVGPNGEGKTNLLEGIYYLCSLTSPRAATDSPLVRKGVSSAYLRGEAEGREGRALVEIEIREHGANRTQVNRSGVRRRRDLRRSLRAVMFGPHDLSVVQGDPAERRSYMDEAIATLWPPKDSLSRAYERVLRQRNRLLKDARGMGRPPALGTWNEELMRAGISLMSTRAEAVEEIVPDTEEVFRRLSGYGLDVEYRPNVQGEDVEEAFVRRLAEREDEEVGRGVTLVGPHRDELHLVVRDMAARGFASHGETWGAALALRIGLAKAVERQIGEVPVLLLDDPFSALDPERRRRVVEMLAGRGQVIVSVADEDHLPRGCAVVWEVSAGTVRVREETGGAAQ